MRLVASNLEDFGAHLERQLWEASEGVDCILHLWSELNRLADFRDRRWPWLARLSRIVVATKDDMAGDPSVEELVAMS